MSINNIDADLGVSIEDSKTFLINVSYEEATLFPEYDGVNDAVSFDELND